APCNATGTRRDCSCATRCKTTADAGARRMRAVDSGHWTRLSALLDELLETEGPQRAERLSQLHSQDPALADELAALLAQQAGIETEQFLEGWALDPPGAGAFAGRAIGSYQLERPIGQGGMGTVWLARRS